ncbi:DUF5018-related domain-containing protein [Sunxiuqinia sp. sy24]|uniref:DUF5018-related domain-containing protein n=1 Tax=Sunxiuqinia sp. sy24 TaxID=3461495 RepID=UPI004045B38D
MKNKIYNYLIQSIFLMLIIGTSSCLTGNLEDIPEFNDAEITDVKFDFRYKDANSNWVDGEPIVKVVRLNVEKDVNVSEGIIEVTLSLPAPDASFTNEIRRQVSLTNLVGKFNISTAATIEPLNDAPTLGIPGDFSSGRRYRVIAADGTTTKEWTIKVNPLPEINAFEGYYQESGTLVRIGNAPDELDAEIYLQTIDSKTCRAQAGKSVFNNSGILYQIQVNADNTVTIKSDPNSVVEIFPQGGVTSTYDPATKTFDLHYHYRNGERLFDTKLVLIE